MSDRVPIFELPLVCLPTERVPLHIFEPRYRSMTTFCLENESPFGIVLNDEGGARSIGCLARIEEVLERFEDGRTNLLVVGTEPFRVLDRFEEAEWPAAEIALEVDEVDTAGGPDAEAARESFVALVNLATGEAPDPAEVAEASSYELAARVELPLDTKQALLERRNEDERMTLLANALGALEKAIGRAAESQERAQSNGNMPH